MIFIIYTSECKLFAKPITFLLCSLQLINKEWPVRVRIRLLKRYSKRATYNYHLKSFCLNQVLEQLAKSSLATFFRAVSEELKESNL